MRRGDSTGIGDPANPAGRFALEQRGDGTDVPEWDKGDEGPPCGRPSSKSHLGCAARRGGSQRLPGFLTNLPLEGDFSPKQRETRHK